MNEHFYFDSLDDYGDDEYYDNDDNDDIKERNRMAKIEEEIDIKMRKIEEVNELRSILNEYKDDPITTSYILSSIKGGGIKKTIRQEQPIIYKIIKNRNDLKELLNMFDNKSTIKSLEEDIIKNIIKPKEVILAKQKSYYIGRLFNQAKKSTNPNFNKLPNELIEHIFGFWNKNKYQPKENLKKFNDGFNFTNKIK